MKHRFLRPLGVVLLVFVALGLLVAPASADRSRAPVVVDKSSPYGIVGNVAVNVRRDEHKPYVDLLRESGTQWHREDFSWERLQPERGGPFRWGGDGFGFQYFDEAVGRVHGAGINVLGLLAYNPAWFKGKNPALDDWIGDWQLYVYNVVSRYGRQRNQIKHWEIWNEENLRGYGYENGLYSVEDYARLLRASAAMIRRADPTAVIVMGGLANIWAEAPPHYYDTFDYLRRLAGAGGWQSFDVLNIHAYRPGPPEGRFQRRERTMDLGDEMHELDTLMGEFGSKPVWFTEIGWGSHVGPYGISELDQAYYIPRLYALALQYPFVERVFWYNFRNNLAYWTPYDKLLFDDTVPDWHMGLIRRTYPLKPEAPDLRKPAFLAYRTMTDLLGRFPMAETLARGDRADLANVYWFRYGSPDQGVQLLWQLGNGVATVVANCSCTEARIRRWNGSLEGIVKAEGGKVKVSIPPGGEPIYLEYGPDVRGASGRYFAETGHTLGGAFLRYWERNGGLAQFGYPITGEIVEPDPRNGRSRIVQYFERNRFEFFPEHDGTPYLVQLGRLGDDQLRARGVQWQGQPVTSATPDGCRRFKETMRLLCPPFRAYWERRGGLSMYGLPLTDAYFENGRMVQYFERNRFEHHAEHAGTPYEVLLGLLGVELFSAR